MKLFSFRKSPVSFKGNEVVIADLAYTHSYKRIGNQLVVEDRCPETEREYKVFYDENGKFQFIEIQNQRHAEILTFFKKEFDLVQHRRIDCDGNQLIVVRKYETVGESAQRLIEVSFASSIGCRKAEKRFLLKGEKWLSEGSFPKDDFFYWQQNRSRFV